MPGEDEGSRDPRGRRTERRAGHPDDAPAAIGRRYSIAAPVSCDCLERVVSRMTRPGVDR